MKKTIMAKDAPAAVGPYVHAVQAGNLLYASGQLGLVPETGELPEDIVAQTKQSLDNVGAVLRAAGYDYKDVIKTTVFIDNMDDFGTVNEIYATYFTGETPARSCVEVAKLPKGALVEIEVVAYKE